MSTRLDVNSVDLKVTENSETHLTTKYLWQNDEKIVVRRGFPINLRLRTTGKPFNPDVQVIVLELTLDGKLPFKDEERIRRIRVRSSQEFRPETSEWTAELVEMNDQTVDISFIFPPNSPIAAWRLKILTGFWSTRYQTIDLDETYYSQLYSPMFFVICNPYILEDETYMNPKQSNARDAYLFLEGEVWYSGIAVGRRNYKFQLNPWLHSQFDENTMMVTMFLLSLLNLNSTRNLPGLSLEERGSVVRVSRKLSFAINRYLLKGNWDKILPPGGRAPTSWLGSAEIMDEFIKSRQPVKYAQCWVYASVFVTILRTIGIPCRTVTCIESAHDADASLTVDRSYLLTRYGGYQAMDDSEENEQTWNFHVWTEMWTRRHDLPSGYDGWQVVDATPQERSEKAFQCGPMPVKAIREGRLELLYDGAFIYGEVNADVVQWFYKKDEQTGNLRLVNTVFRGNDFQIGRALLTPSPRKMEYPINITSDYKANEGGHEERLVHIRAIKSAGASERHEKIRLLYQPDLEKDIKEDVQIEIDEIMDVSYGSPIRLHIEIQNTSNFTRTISLSVVVVTQFHTGAESSKINQHNETITLGPREGDTLQFTTSVTEYAKYVAYLRELSATISASVVETHQAIFVEEKFQISGSAVRIEAPNNTKVGEKVYGTVYFTNPLNTTLHNLELILHSGKYSKPVPIKKFPSSVAGRQRVKVRVAFRAIDKGSRILVAVVNSREISNMNAMHFVRAVDSNLYNTGEGIATL